MTSATVAGGGTECCAEASAMICSLGDSITLLGIRSHRQAEAARLCGIRRRNTRSVQSSGRGALRAVGQEVCDRISGAPVPEREAPGAGHEKSPESAGRSAGDLTARNGLDLGLGA